MFKKDENKIKLKKWLNVLIISGIQGENKKEIELFFSRQEEINAKLF